MNEKLKMEQKAIAFREQFNLGELSPIRFNDFLRKHNVMTLFKPMSEKLSGMAIKVDDMRFMLVNSALSLGRQHFTIAHELYHLFVQENFTSQLCVIETFSKKDKEEYSADLFASHLLLPRAGVLKSIPTGQIARDKIELSTIIEIEQHHGSSRAALLYLLAELGLLSEDKREQFSVDVYHNAHDLSYPTHLYLPTKENKFIGDDYIDTVRKLYKKDKIRQIEFLTFLQDVGISEI